MGFKTWYRRYFFSKHFLGLTLNMQSSKKISKTIEYLKMEDERCKIFLEGLIRYREWEEERMNTVY
jgi:hypothetical protein